MNLDKTDQPSGRARHFHAIMVPSVKTAVRCFAQERRGGGNLSFRRRGRAVSEFGFEDAIKLGSLGKPAYKKNNLRPQRWGNFLCSPPRRHANAAHARRAKGLRRHCEGREIHGIVIDTTKLSAGERVHQPKRGTLDGGGIEHKQPRDPQDIAETSASSSPPRASQTNIERPTSTTTTRSSTTCEWARRAPSTA